MTKPSEPTRILVADDHPAYRESLVRAIKARPDLELVAEVADGRAALEEIKRLEPTVCVLDLDMPELDGSAVLNAVTRDRLPCRVVLLSGRFDSGTAYKAVEDGAGGLVEKTSVASDICDAIAAVARGETILPAELQSGLAEQIRLHRSANRPTLTDREHEILRLVSEGNSVPDIAKELQMAPGTVKTHLGHLYEKLGVSDRAAAVARAMRSGLIE